MAFITDGVYYMSMKNISGDFEVMPLGTRAELTRLREFASEMINIADDGVLPPEADELVQELELFFEDHNERFPG